MVECENKEKDQNGSRAYRVPLLDIHTYESIMADWSHDYLTSNNYYMIVSEKKTKKKKQKKKKTKKKKKKKKKNRMQKRTNLECKKGLILDTE